MNKKDKNHRTDRLWSVELTLTSGEVLEVYVRALTKYDAEERVRKGVAFEYRRNPVQVFYLR